MAGASHRRSLVLTLRYLQQLLGRPAQPPRAHTALAAEPSPRAAVWLAAELLAASPGAVASLAALLGNESGLIAELAAGCLADLLALAAAEAPGGAGQGVAAAGTREGAAACGPLAEALLQLRLAAAAVAGSAQGSASSRAVVGAGASRAAASAVADADVQVGGSGAEEGAEGRTTASWPALTPPASIAPTQAAALLASNGGRAIAAQLRDGGRAGGLVRELCRLLVALWAPPHVPRVQPLACCAVGGAGEALDAGLFQDGLWRLQEFSAQRGDVLPALSAAITFSAAGLTTAEAAADAATRGGLLPRLPSASSQTRLPTAAGSGAAGAAALSRVPAPQRRVTDSGPLRAPSGGDSHAGPHGGPSTARGAAEDARRSWAGEGGAAARGERAGDAVRALALLDPLGAGLGAQAAGARSAFPLLGPDGRPLGGTAAALVALSGGTRSGERAALGLLVREACGGGGTC